LSGAAQPASASATHRLDIGPSVSFGLPRLPNTTTGPTGRVSRRCTTVRVRSQEEDPT
jgi:hypothetical protein